MQPRQGIASPKLATPGPTSTKSPQRWAVTRATTAETAVWRRTLLPQVLDDLRALAEVDEELVDAALRAISDLAGRRRIGKALGARLVSGDLEGCRRLRFDLSGRRPERYRVVYRLRPARTALTQWR